MEENKSYLVYIFIDPITERLIGSAKVGKFLDEAPPLFKDDETYEGIVWQSTDLGYKVIIQHSHTGLLFHSEVYRPLNEGDCIAVEIKNIRPDGKIDLKLPKSGAEKSDEISEIILAKLKENNGFLPLSDHTDPALIKTILGVSKKSFKKGIGKLYKDRVVNIEDNGIYLLLEE